MKISFVEPHLLIFGGIRRVIEFSNRFVARGEDVTIYHPSGEPCDWMECSATVRPLRELNDREHDVVIFNNPPDYPHARRARARLKVFYILALYEHDKLKRFDPKIFWPKKGRILALKRCLQLPFLQVANATWMQHWLRDNMGMDVHLQLGGINREMFRPLDVAPRGDGRFRVLCSGDNREYKGAGDVAAAIEIVRQTHPEVVLETYHGKGIPQSEMAAKYCSADLFVDGQWHAGWNNPVAEALACGRPVVCTDIGGVTDFARHEETALVVPSRDPKAMAAAIERIIESPELGKRLAERGLASMAQFDWEVSTERFLDLLYSHARIARRSSS